ncbi:toxin-antitoxin system YwqK family antitoxin [Marinigracilibium pacificum]|uniref:Antitoxin component YwqK of YwqJK toxin-antitoxin module n=1 Tax=Marinigracilibium pacificum TaxID=2729599 RepID=A0A848J210_9BACT|nr:hypothetical protein [Marinigracilibium pacificum]NMM49761.1 hypothetical protein [Marinigracilibium pacificum]
MKKQLYITALFLTTSFLAFSQDTEYSVISSDVPESVNLEIGTNDDEEDEEVKLKEKKKKKEFYGIKTRKMFTKRGVGQKVVYEKFYLLKVNETPNKYVRDIHYYSYDERKIKVTTPDKYDPELGPLLHGPYRQFNTEHTLMEGIFYKGMKHGRWETYGKMYDYYVLKDKEKYFRGWPKNSYASYYDADRKKLKEVIPIEYGEKEGYYYYFHENGLVAVVGEYENGEKVGVWTEFYERRRRKRQMQYRDNPYDNDFIPYVLKEWDERGKVIFEYNPVYNAEVPVEFIQQMSSK